MNSFKKTAADEIQRIERSQAVKAFVTPRNILFVLLVCAIGFAYCQGKRTAYSSATTSELASEWNRWSDSVNAKQDDARKDSLVLVSAIGQANVARTAYKKLSSRIAVVDKDHVAIDGGPATPEVAASIVEDLISSANGALTSDSTVHVASVNYLADVKAQVAVIAHQRDIAVEQGKRDRRTWYNGWKAGAVGVLAVLVSVAVILK